MTFNKAALYSYILMSFIELRNKTMYWITRDKLL